VIGFRARFPGQIPSGIDIVTTEVERGGRSAAPVLPGGDKLGFADGERFDKSLVRS
jgi:hypothetical protein